MAEGRVTVIDIAKAAGVSKSTVSLVLQGSASVKSETRARVNAAIRDLGYVYNRGAATLRQTGSRSKIIGVIVNDLTNSFFAELAVGIDMVVQSAGYVQFLSSCAENPDRQQELISSMREHGVSGLIICPARGTQVSDFKALEGSSIPVVVAVRNLPGTKASTLMSANAEGTRAATEHLLSLGHRRIAFLGGFSDMAVLGERVSGYRDALRDAGILFDEQLVVNAPSSRAGGVEAIGRALSLAEPPSAAVCLNDAVAFGVCDGLRSRKLEPGTDFAVVGFDDVIEAKTAVPALTTVSVDPQGMGRRAATLLLKQINSNSSDGEAVITAVRLVVRESSGKAINTRQEMAS